MKFLSFMNTRIGRGIRFAFGALVLAAGVITGGGLGAGLIAFSVLPIATGVLRICPINPLLGQPLRACPVARPRTKRT